MLEMKWIKWNSSVQYRLTKSNEHQTAVLIIYTSLVNFFVFVNLFMKIFWIFSFEVIYYYYIIIFIRTHTGGVRRIFWWVHPYTPPGGVCNNIRNPLPMFTLTDRGLQRSGNANYPEAFAEAFEPYGLILLHPSNYMAKAKTQVLRRKIRWI